MFAQNHHARRAAFVLALFVGLAIGVAAGCGDDDDGPTNPPPAANEDTIRIVVNAFNKMSMAFTPNPDTVEAGTTVRWINTDGTPHTVTSESGSPESFHLSIAAGGSQIRAFNNPGSFPYICSIFGHQMNGTLVVIP